MPKPVPVPNELSKPFWDGVNEGKLLVQNCTACNRKQYPPQPTCAQCGSGANLVWLQTSGRGKILDYVVQYDARIVIMKADQPFNVAVITLEEDPDIKFFSNLPGVPVDQVPIGATVQAIFVPVSPDQKVTEWQVVS